MSPANAQAFIEALEELRADDGATVSILGGRRHIVDVTAAWTRWRPIRFTGQSVLTCLRGAVACRRYYRRAHPND